MPRFLVSGGRQAVNAYELQEWNRSEAGVLLLVDTDQGSVKRLMEYRSDPALLSATERMGTTFKCGEVVGGDLYIPTEWEVLRIRLADMEIVEKWSSKFFNDVHAVTLRGDNLIVTSTGLDAVFEVGRDGLLINEWSVLEGRNIWEKFDKDVDYRKVPSTKPHASHPNFSVVMDGEIWTTRFIQKDVVCLTDPTRKGFEVGVERPHDGHLINGKLYYTTVNGSVVIIDPTSGQQDEVFDLNACKRDMRPLGWCRGLARADQMLFLGFSRLRPTKLTANLAWVKDLRKNLSTSVSRPTRLGVYDFSKKQHIKDINLEPYGMNILFSIMPIRDALADSIFQGDV